MKGLTWQLFLLSGDLWILGQLLLSHGAVLTPLRCCRWGVSQCVASWGHGNSDSLRSCKPFGGSFVFPKHVFKFGGQNESIKVQSGCVREVFWWKHCGGKDVEGVRAEPGAQQAFGFHGHKLQELQSFCQRSRASIALK